MTDHRFSPAPYPHLKPFSIENNNSLLTTIVSGTKFARPFRPSCDCGHNEAWKLMLSEYKYCAKMGIKENK
jgi:hypothetical protein